MPILATLKKEFPGEWPSLADFLREARRRETSALGALAAASAAPSEEQRELAQGEGGEVLLELARDLRVPKGARLASTRCLVEAGAAPDRLAALFAGAGDLVTDPRLGAAARKLVEQGLPAALRQGGEIARVSFPAGAFARAVQAASSAVGVARTKELLGGAKGHAGAAAARFALGDGELEERGAWQKLLDETCAANRKAPAAAKRLGLAPPWPPNLPEAFAPLVKAAEESAGGVQPADPASNRSPSKATGRPAAVVPVPAAAKVATVSPRAEATSKPPSPSGHAETRNLAPPIRRSPIKRPIGTVVEVPTRPPAKAMEPIAGRGTGGPPAPTPPRVDREPQKASPLPGMAALLRNDEEARFDPRGKRIPRPDRWDEKGFGWETPALPPSTLPAPAKVAAAPGPFAQRLASLFQNRPEAVDRLCAAADARSALSSEALLLQDLEHELGRSVWKGRIPPAEQVARLRAVEADSAAPGAWRTVARFLLVRLKIA